MTWSTLAEQRFERWGHIWHWNVCCARTWYLTAGAIWASAGRMRSVRLRPHLLLGWPQHQHWKGEKMESTFPISVHHFHSCTCAPPGRARWRNRGEEEILDQRNLKTLWPFRFNRFWGNLDKFSLSNSSLDRKKFGQLRFDLWSKHLMMMWSFMDVWGRGSEIPPLTQSFSEPLNQTNQLECIR